MAGSRAVIVGDVIDDVIVVLHGPIRLDTDTASSITRRPGGSASNTAAWMAWLGTGVDLVARVGAGDLERHAAELSASGVTAHLSEDPSRGTGTIVILVEGERRTMLTDRGANATLDPDAVSDALLAQAGILHLTGYSLVDALSPRTMCELVGRAHAHAAVVSFDPSSVGFIADVGVALFREAIRGVDVLRPNLAEGRLLSGLGPEEPPRGVAEALLELAPVVLLTCGVEGVVVATRGEGVGPSAAARGGGAPCAGALPRVVELPAAPVPTVDPTGAGDSFTAGFLAARLRGADLEAAAREGQRIASIAVGRLGGRPPAG